MDLRFRTTGSAFRHPLPSSQNIRLSLAQGSMGLTDIKGQSLDSQFKTASQSPPQQSRHFKARQSLNVAVIVFMSHLWPVCVEHFDEPSCGLIGQGALTPELDRNSTGKESSKSAKKMSPSTPGQRGRLISIIDDHAPARLVSETTEPQRCP